MNIMAHMTTTLTLVAPTGTPCSEPLEGLFRVSHLGQVFQIFKDLKVGLNS